MSAPLRAAAFVICARSPWDLVAITGDARERGVWPRLFCPCWNCDCNRACFTSPAYLRKFVALLHAAHRHPAHLAISSCISYLYAIHIHRGLLPFHWTLGALLHAAAAVAFSRLFLESRQLSLADATSSPAAGRHPAAAAAVTSAATSATTSATTSASLSGQASRLSKMSLAPVAEGDESLKEE
jgi:hypothetical protein